MTGAVQSGWWSMGPRVADFEERFAAFCGVAHALAVAMHCGTPPCVTGARVRSGRRGDRAFAELRCGRQCNRAHWGYGDLLRRQRARRPQSPPADVEAAIGPATKAILVLHYGGFPCQMGAILRLAERHALHVVEDAAHAPGASWQGQMCGTLGRIGCFSFFSNKNLPVGEGGMVVTDDDELAQKIRLLRSHGMTSLTWDRHRGHAHSYDVVEYGFNYRLDELHAAIGLVQLARLPNENAARMRIAERYRVGLDGIAGLTMPFKESDARNSSSYHPGGHAAA